MKKIIFLFVVISELAVIAFLAGKIYIDNKQVLGENVSINPILKDDIIFPNQDKDSGLKYFYEPKPNNVQTDKPERLPPDYTYTATINSDSLNERFDYSIEKDSDVFRIITLGDSYTFGANVNTPENYPERLEDMLNNSSLCKTTKKFEVINLGVGGYDIEYSIHRFAIRGKKYDPDFILWLINNGDFTKPNEFYIPKINRFKEEISSDSALLAEFRSGGDYYRWAKKNIVKELTAEIGDDGLAYSRKALDKIHGYYKGRLIFITFSGRKALKKSDLSLLQSFAEDRGNTYIYNGISSNYDRFEKDAHPTSKGHAQIAGEIFEYLEQSDLVPCY